MYLPRDLFSLPYGHLIRTRHAQSSPVTILVALEPDALCACRILASLFKRDYISHSIIPVSGYQDLARAGERHVQPMRTQNGGSGGTVVCLGVGGMVDLGSVLGLEATEDDMDMTGGVEIWVIDARRPWNLGNIFGGRPPDSALVEVSGNARARQPEVSRGEVQRNYRPGKGGIIVFDDGDVAELDKEREAYFELLSLPPIDDDGHESDESEAESEPEASGDEQRLDRKRNSWSGADEDDESEDDDDRPRKRRRSNSVSCKMLGREWRLTCGRQQESITTTSVRPAQHSLLSVSTDVSTSQPPSPSDIPPSHQQKSVSLRRNRRRLLRLRRAHETTLNAYYSLGASYSEPISSILYSLASDLGREDNDGLWYAIVGVSSLELYGRTMTGVGVSSSSLAGSSACWGGDRGERIRQVLRDEVRRLNPPDPTDTRSELMRGETSGVIPTTARSPTDTSIRLSPEPRFLLVRHWSLYESMLHSPYLAACLHVWSKAGRERLNKLLATMGISLRECKQSYTHMDMDLKKGLRQRLLKYAPMYGLEGLVPPAASQSPNREGWGFVRCWGWKACFSAVDVAVVVGAILEVGKGGAHGAPEDDSNRNGTQELADQDGRLESEEYVERFWEAYDALENVSALLSSLPPTLALHRSILRTGTALLSKNQIGHLRAFSLGIIKSGPDVQLFTHPGALTKLALWVTGAIAEQKKYKEKEARGGAPLVLASLNEKRGVYVVVGTGGSGGVVDEEARRERKRRKEDRECKKQERERRTRERKAKRGGEVEDGDDEEEEEETESDEDDDPDEGGVSVMIGKNRFGHAFAEVADETGAITKIDSFETCVVEVKKEHLNGFLEALSIKAVVG